MSMIKSIYSDIMKEYEAIRKCSDKIVSDRKKEMYTKIPRLMEIDNQLAKIGIDVAKLVLSNSKEASCDIEQFQKKSLSLQEEKKELMQKFSFPQNYLQVFRCRKCNDTGYVGSEKCSCFKQKLIDRFYDLSNLKNVLDEENFDMFRFEYFSDKIDTESGTSPQKNIRTIYERANKFTRKFNDEFTNLFFWGNTGLGKTFTCNCIAKDILNLGKTVIYLTAPKLFKTLEESLFDNKSDAKEYAKMLYSVDLLIIDDLGSEFATLPTTSELFDIINSRLLDRKSVVISTNLSLTEFQELYSARIFSRIIGNYVICHFIGSDIRSQKKYINSKIFMDGVYVN